MTALQKKLLQKIIFNINFHDLLPERLPQWLWRGSGFWNFPSNPKFTFPLKLSLFVKTKTGAGLIWWRFLSWSDLGEHWFLVPGRVLYPKRNVGRSGHFQKRSTVWTLLLGKNFGREVYVLWQAVWSGLAPERPWAGLLGQNGQIRKVKQFYDGMTVSGLFKGNLVGMAGALSLALSWKHSFW